MTPKQARDLMRRCTPKEFRQMRQDLRLTQGQLGKYFGVTQQSIARMEKAQSRIHFAAEMLLRAMFIQDAGLALHFTKWLTRHARKRQ